MVDPIRLYRLCSPSFDNSKHPPRHLREQASSQSIQCQIVRLRMRTEWRVLCTSSDSYIRGASDLKCMNQTKSEPLCDDFPRIVVPIARNRGESRRLYRFD